MSLFVDENDTMSAEIVIGKSKSRPDWIFADTDEKTLKDAIGEDLTSIETHKIVFRTPSFADSIINSGMTVVNDVVTVNPAEIRAERLYRLLKTWTFKTEDGKDVPVNKQNIMKLHPMVAAVLLIQLDKLLSDRGLG